MNKGFNTIVYPVSDIARARSLFRTLLGADPVFDEPYYVQFQAGEQQIGLDPNGHGSGMTGPVAFCHVDDVRAALQGLLDAGAQLQQDVKDVGGGKLVATVKDADGNVIGLVQSSWTK